MRSSDGGPSVAPFAAAPKVEIERRRLFENDATLR